MGISLCGETENSHILVFLVVFPWPLLEWSKVDLAVLSLDLIFQQRNSLYIYILEANLNVGPIREIVGEELLFGE